MAEQTPVSAPREPWEIEIDAALAENVQRVHGIPTCDPSDIIDAALSYLEERGCYGTDTGTQP